MITHCPTPAGPRAASGHRPCSSIGNRQEGSEDAGETSGTGEFSTAPPCSGLEPGCRWNPPAFGWGRNGRSRCREQIPVGNGAEASSLEAVVPELSLIAHITSREAQTVLGSNSPKAFLSRHKGAGSLSPSLFPSAPSAPHPQIFQCWGVLFLLLFSPSSLSRV